MLATLSFYYAFMLLKRSSTVHALVPNSSNNIMN
jgi:hypothetical protein